jgi:hypothetical protein
MYLWIGGDGGLHFWALMVIKLTYYRAIRATQMDTNSIKVLVLCVCGRRQAALVMMATTDASELCEYAILLRTQSAKLGSDGRRRRAETRTVGWLIICISS